MRESDVVKLLILLEAEYPNSFSKLDEQQKALKKELWVKEFAEDDYTLVFTATRLLMRDGREFAPSCGQIRAKMESLLQKETLNEQQAWALVSKACSNGYYGYRKEFDKLPPEVQKAVGSPEQIKEWSVMDITTFQSVVASNFMRSYRATVEREKELARIPESVRSALRGVSEKLRLTEGTQ